MSKKKPSTQKDQLSEVWDVVRGTNGQGLEARVENMEANMVTQAQCAAIQVARPPMKPSERSPHIKWNDRINRGIQILTLAALVFAWLGLKSDGFILHAVKQWLNENGTEEVVE